MERSAEPEARSRWSSLGWVLPLVLLLSLAVAYFSWAPFRQFVTQAYQVASTGEEERIQQWVRGYDSWGVVVLLALMFLQSVIAVLPSIATMVAAVLAYGPSWGGALAWGGMMLTGSFMFAVGRALGPVTVERFMGETASKKVERAVERYGSWAIIIARLTPLSSSDAVSFIAGAVRMRYSRFLLAMAAGTLPLTVLIAWLGHDMQRLKAGLVVISVLAVATFAGHFVWRRARGDRSARRAPSSASREQPDCS